MTASETITYLCVAPDHAKVKLERGTQNLTIHAGSWAVCPAGQVDGHEWKGTAPVQYEDLFSRRAAEKHPI